MEPGGGVQYVVEAVAAEGYERHDFMPWQKRWQFYPYDDDDDDGDSINGDNESDEGEKLTEMWRIVQHESVVVIILSIVAGWL